MIRRVSRGWGEWDNTVPFDPLMTAYYPECRTRLGFYDDLSDLAAVTTGKVSYTVIGWYSRINFDPFYNDRFRRKDRVGHRDDLRVHKTIATPVVKTALQTEMAWDVTVQSKATPRLSRNETTALKVAVEGAGDRLQDARDFAGRASSPPCRSRRPVRSTPWSTR